jgi:hypothetical protein
MAISGSILMMGKGGNNPARPRLQRLVRRIAVRSLTAERQIDDAALEMAVVVRLFDDLQLPPTVF